MRNPMIGALLGAATALAIAGQARAEDDGRYTTRSMTLEGSTLRLDFGPQDFALMDSFVINSGRGLRIYDAGDEPGVYFGAGFSVGATDDIEVGALLLPMNIAPDPHFGDMEAYGRFRLVRGGAFELGLQPAIQFPTDTETGLAFGVPMLARAGRSARIDFGPELEFLFYEDEVLNFDFPVAFNFALGDRGFLGFRTGLLVWDFGDEDNDAVFMPLGMQGGVIFADGKVDLTPWFLFPNFLYFSDEDDPVHEEPWEIGLGLLVRIDV